MKEKHFEKECLLCHKKFKPELLEEHMKKCDCKMKCCKYCELQMKDKDLLEHEYICGAKTELCRLCGKYITKKDLEKHRIDGCFDLLIYEGKDKKEVIIRAKSNNDITKPEKKQSDATKEVPSSSINSNNPQRGLRNLSVNRANPNLVEISNKHNLPERKDKINNDKTNHQKEREEHEIDSFSSKYNQLNEEFNRYNDLNTRQLENANLNFVRKYYRQVNRKNSNKIQKPKKENNDIELLYQKYNVNNEVSNKEYTNVYYHYDEMQNHNNHKNKKDRIPNEYINRQKNTNIHKKYDDLFKKECLVEDIKREKPEKYDRCKYIQKPALERFDNNISDYNIDKYNAQKKKRNQEDHFTKQIPEKDVGNDHYYQKIIQPANQIKSVQKKDFAKNKKKENLNKTPQKKIYQPSQKKNEFKEKKEAHQFDVGKYIDDYLPDDVFD